MARQLEDSMRALICKKYDLGDSYSMIARELRINPRTVASVVTLYRKEGRIEAIKKRKPRSIIINQDIQDSMKEMMSDDASITLEEMKSRVFAAHRVSASVATLHRAICNFSYSFKRIALIPYQRNTARTIEIRYEYARNMVRENEEKIIYLDEMGVSCSMRKRYGRSLVGTSPRKTVSTIRSKNYSVTAAISSRGVMAFEISDKAYNGERYHAFLGRLIEELARLECTEALLIMDNCSMHKVEIVRDLVGSAGHRIMFLPPYTPQLNPIEEVFSKWKALIKNMNCENVEHLIEATETAHLMITPWDCENYVAHSKEFLLLALERREF